MSVFTTFVHLAYLCESYKKRAGIEDIVTGYVSSTNQPIRHLKLSDVLYQPTGTMRKGCIKLRNGRLTNRLSKSDITEGDFQLRRKRIENQARD